MRLSLDRRGEWEQGVVGDQAREVVVEPTWHGSAPDEHADFEVAFDGGGGEVGAGDQGAVVVGDGDFGVQPGAGGA